MVSAAHREDGLSRQLHGTLDIGIWLARCGGWACPLPAPLGACCPGKRGSQTSPCHSFVCCSHLGSLYPTRCLSLLAMMRPMILITRASSAVRAIPCFGQQHFGRQHMWCRTATLLMLPCFVCSHRSAFSAHWLWSRERDDISVQQSGAGYPRTRHSCRCPHWLQDDGSLRHIISIFFACSPPPASTLAFLHCMRRSLAYRRFRQSKA